MNVLVQENSVYCDTADKKFQPELPTLVLIHGAQNDHSVWNWHRQRLAHHGYNILAIDLPGHGLSQGKAKTSIEAMAQWMLELFDVIGIKKGSLAGHSMGSLIALETVRIAPHRIEKLALLGNAYPMKVADALLTTAFNDEPAAIDMVTNWSHFSTTKVAPGTGSSLQANLKRLMQRLSKINSDHLLFTDLSACNNYALGEEAAGVIKQHHHPVLFLIAQQDRMTPAKASANLRAFIPEARVIEIAGCGHAMMAEQPDVVFAALGEFLK